MSWLSAAVPVGDELFLYYGGYARGHKIAPETERQIGLVRIPRDRYAGLKTTDDSQGRLRTLPLRLAGESLAINFASEGGPLRVRVLNADGTAIPGYGEQDCNPMTGDHLAAQVCWTNPLSRLKGTVARFEFIIHRGTLFGFDLIASK